MYYILMYKLFVNAYTRVYTATYMYVSTHGHACNTQYCVRNILYINSIVQSGRTFTPWFNL